MYASLLFVLPAACCAADFLALVQLQSHAFERVAGKRIVTPKMVNVSRMKIGGCIGDICVQSVKDLVPGDEFPFWDIGISARSNFKGEPACPADQPQSQRTLLLLLVPPYHGSTALAQVLMSSDSLSTLCTNSEWQCEGGPTMRHLSDSFSRDPNTWTGDAMLEAFSQFWNLSRPVLVDKTPLYLGAVPHIVESLAKAMIPQAMSNVGIKMLSKSYVIMWRPVCLSYLSTAGRERIESNKKGLGEHELELLEQLVHDHKYLSDNKIPSLVVNFADLLWRPRYVKLRLESFMPCLGSVSMEYVPIIGKDVYEGNSWKTDGSVQSYGESIDPERCCGYDPSTRKCSNKTNFFHLASEPSAKKADELEEYMDKLS